MTQEHRSLILESVESINALVLVVALLFNVQHMSPEDC